jgi:hypothetical protein
MTPTRREFTAGALSLAAATSFGDVAMASAPVPNLILRNGRITTLDRARPAATALAVRDGRIEAVGSDNEITKLAGAGTRVVDLAGHRLIPGSTTATRISSEAASITFWSCAGTESPALPTRWRC